MLSGRHLIVGEWAEGETTSVSAPAQGPRRAVASFGRGASTEPPSEAA